MVRTGASWRMMPHDLPPWYTLYQQSQRWLKAGVFEAIVHDLREILRLTAGRKAKPTAAIFDSRTCNRRPNRVREQPMTGPNGAKAVRHIWPLIPWVTC